MKSITFVVLTVCCLTLSCFAQENTGGGGGGGGVTPATTTVLDAEWAAAAYLSAGPVSYYYGSFDYRRVVAGYPVRWISGTFKLVPGTGITELTIDGVGVPIPADQPLAGLPEDVSGEVQDFSLFVSGRTKDGTAAVFGYMNDDVLATGESIIVTLKPEWRPVLVKYSAAGSPDNLRLRLWSVDYGYRSEGWRYNAKLGRFEVWVNPLDERISYEVYDAITGHVYATGTLNYINVPPAASVNVINFDYERGVVRLPFPEENYSYYENVSLDSPVEWTTGSSIPGKVYFAHLSGAALYVSVGGIEGKIRVSRCDNNGNTKVILNANSNADNHIAFEVPSGYDKVIVTIVGQPASGRQIDAFFYYYYY